MSTLPYSITVPWAVRGKQRARVTRFGSYTPKETKRAEAELGWEAKGIRAPLLFGPVQLTIEIEIEPPKSWNRGLRLKALTGGSYPTAKPDLDNVVKLIGDALNGIAWADDKQIVMVTACKRYMPTDRTKIGWGPMPEIIPPGPIT